MPIESIEALARSGPGAVLPYACAGAQAIPETVLPTAQALSHARSSLVRSLADQGLGYQKATGHLLNDVVPAFSNSSRSPNYYGFVTGGATPAAALADSLVSAYDQNVQVHLPDETIATEVEDCALRLLCELLRLDPAQWPHRTFTTGATASNVMGLACGREYIVSSATSRRPSRSISVGELGLPGALRAAGIDDVQILTTVPHSSLAKAASVVGIGRASVKQICLADAPHRFDMSKLESALALERTASIVAISCSEVNTGRFATEQYDDMKRIRELCDKHGAWIHVDAAFGLFGRILDKPGFSRIVRATEGLELADSITGDGHKLLNVPYDCGIFFSRHLQIGQNTFQNANAAYLTSGTASGSSVQSPLNIGIENSRRFRALPVYTTLVAYGREGYQDMLERQIILSRAIAALILDHPDFELLPSSQGSREDILDEIYIIVLFKARDEQLNRELVRRINEMSKVYISGTSWEGAPACRFAVSNWRVDVDRDVGIIRDTLNGVSEQFSREKP